jgi:23S rRNA pseudouridine1911/1915/1917 synthase
MAPRPPSGVTESGARRLCDTVRAADTGARLDQWLVARLADISRTRIKALVDQGRVRVDGRVSKAGHRLRPGERVDADIPPAPAAQVLPEAVPLDIVFEDDHVLVVDKSAGMVTHPGAGCSTGTLAAAALAHAPGMAAVGSPRRPGIVHRLDKGTSGLIVLAKTQRAYDGLTAQLARRSVTRRYLCLVQGVPDRPEGTIDRPIARDPRSRVRMAVAPAGKGKRAVTRFRVLERFAGAALVECRLETGRTHQIRVHLASIGHPVLGDLTYGRGRTPVAHARREPGGGDDPELPALMHALGGVALHAAGLAFVHPVSGERLEFSSTLPYRIEGLLSHLRRRSGGPRGRNAP